MAEQVGLKLHCHYCTAAQSGGETGIHDALCSPAHATPLIDRTDEMSGAAEASKIWLHIRQCAIYMLGLALLCWLADFGYYYRSD